MNTQLDELQNQLKELEFELQKIKTDKLKAEREYQKTLDKVLDIRKHIDELEKVAKATIRVTDHAVVRYLERFQGIDVNSVKQSIIDKVDLDSLKVLGGSGRIKIDNMKIVVDNYTVLTVTEL